MGKKRKGSGRGAEASKDEEFNERGGRIAPINGFEDIADSEDEFHLNRDKVMLEEGPDAKRRKRWLEQEAELELSDEEILGYSTAGEEEDEDDDEAQAPTKRVSNKTRDSDEEASEDEEEEVGGWGASRKDYYDNDQIETEADALEEEAEAKRLQQKKLQKMSEADFGFDENEWLDAGNDEDDGDVVTEVLKDVEITPEMSPDERLRILHTRYPEFEFLANEFLQLQSVLVDLQQQADSEPTRKSTLHPISPTVIKCRALGAYVAALVMYFALLTSPAKDGETAGRAMQPDELRDHAVMDSILKCRQLWSKVKSLETPASLEVMSAEESVSDIETPTTNGKTQINGMSKPSKIDKKDKKALARHAAAAEVASVRAAKIQAAEEQLQDLSSLIPKTRRSTRAPEFIEIAEDNSDFGEEETMDAKSAAEKANKKKSLRFYTSQIVQKSNKRAGAGRDAGGDMDVPVRERLRDRQARLNAEAEIRGKKLDEYGRGGAALDGESESDDGGVAEEAREGEDEYYDMVAKVSKKKQDEKAEKSAAFKQAQAEGKMVRIVEGEMDEEGKRAIGYVIEKNKGLAPKRKKDVRNPRVKKRKKFEEKKKKLASMRAVYKGGEDRGGYGGEKTGIKAGLIKSIKL